MKFSLVSVVMTTYNGERFLREQIDSILNQTYQHLELVICDDCSTGGQPLPGDLQQVDRQQICFRGEGADFVAGSDDESRLYFHGIF